MLSKIERRVLNTLVEQTNEPQGEWTTRRTLWTVCAANGTLTDDQTETALVGLVDAELVEQDGDAYRPADGVDRVPHPGEK